MTTLRRHRRMVVLVAGLFGAVIVTSAVVSYLASSARATGIPTSKPLNYQGLLADSAGKPLTGSKSIGVDLWSAASGGSKKCSTAAASTTLVQGRFRLALSATCTQAVQDTADLWVEVIVDGKSMGRSKIGAVPYAVVAKTVEEQSCPPGYTQDASTTAYTLCKNGADEVVKVGDFWIDRYEMSIVNAAAYSKGKCNVSGVQRGVSSDDYPTSFPDTGNVSTKLYACSKSGNKPSAWMTWFQAVAACAFAGKHLCTNGEWQAAALGSPDSATACNIATAGAENAGNRTTCVSQFGALDMVGNLAEWVDHWGQAGKSSATYTPGAKVTWPAGYGGDESFNVNGQVYNNGAWIAGLPAVPHRGGYYDAQAGAGAFSLDWWDSPTNWGGWSGARCCRR